MLDERWTTFERPKVESNFFRPRSGKELGHRDLGPDDDVHFSSSPQIKAV